MTHAEKVQAEKPPLLVLNSLIFAITGLVTLVAVPWYGISHGYSVGLWAFFALFVAANEMSITAGYHRLWSHKTYEAHGVLRVIYFVFGTMALQNSVFVWASGHRRHHLHVDDNEKDPYSSGRGFWFSHIGWMLRNYKSGMEDLSNIPDLKRDKLLAFQHRYYALLAIGLNFGIPILVGLAFKDLWGALLLTGVARLVVSHHFTFFINSLAHMWGKRPYTEENTARDNALLALITFGEGYHNFHHIFAHDYRNGVRWWQWDPTKWLIASCSYVGLSRKLKRTPAFQIQRARIAMQLSQAQRRLVALAEVPGRPSHLEQLRTRVSQEYDALAAAVAEWTHVKELWLEEKKRAVIEHWEHASFQTRLREIEGRLKAQRLRLRLLHAELAAPAFA